MSRPEFQPHLVPGFVRSLAAQLAQAPTLAPGYGHALCSAPGLLSLLSPASCARDPGLAFVSILVHSKIFT